MVGKIAEPLGRGDADVQRPSKLLSVPQLLQISMYWFALNAIWGGFEVFQQKRVIALVSTGPELALALMELLAMPVAMLTMPIAGSVSDYTSTRWGKRKPFILAGSAATSIAMIGLALSQHIVVLVCFFVLLQLTSNIARGPFAGLVPDLVPEKQVGTASGLMGLMITLGLVGGYLIVATGYLPVFDQDFTIPVITLGLLVLAAGIGTTLWVPNGPPGKPREGRTWPTVALETFGTDILHQRSYVFLLGSRFCILMATGFFMNLNILYMERVFAIKGPEQGAWVIAALAVSVVATVLGTIPGARISDIVGRKPVIFASAAIGAVGMAVVGLAPSMQVALIGIGIVGLGGGAFLSVDWALMTEIIPKASAGRYMGMSNIVEATNGPLATTVGSAVMFAIGYSIGLGAGARAAMLAAIALYVLGAVFLTAVKEPHRQRLAPAPAKA